MIRLPSAEDPVVSVIVLLDGSVEMAERCLTAIAAGDDGVPLEVVLVLNDPDPALEKFVRGSTTGGRIVLSPGNAGPGVGWNLGAAVARAPRLATMHEDSEPDEGWLPPLLAAMDEHGAGAVGPRLYNGDGSVQNCGWVLFADASVTALTAASAPEVVAASEPTPADVLSGAATLVDREAVRAVGGWDERFHPAVYVDIDLSVAIWNLGKPVLSVPASGVRHQSGAFDSRPASALTGSHLRTFLVERNRGPFLAKWGPFVRERAAPPDYTDPESIRAAVSAALELTRDRAEQVRSGSWRPPRPSARAEARFTGLAASPVRDAGDGSFEVAPEVVQALAAAEDRLVREYCLSLVQKGKDDFERLRAANQDLERLRAAVAEVQEHAGNLQQQNQELLLRNQEVSLQLDSILNGRTWRLRTAVVRTLQRLRRPGRRAG